MKAIKLNLLKFKNSCVLRIQGKTGKKACLVIPIEDAHLVDGEKGVYADLLECELKQPGQYGDVALVRQSLPREVFDAMSEEERRAMPILGNVKPVQARTVADEAEEVPAAAVEVPDDDLPF